MFGLDKDIDMKLVEDFNKNSHFKNGKDLIKNELDYERFINIMFEFESVKGKYNKYIKTVKRSFLKFFYDNIWNSSSDDVILIDLYGYKIDGNNVNDLLFYIRNKKSFQGTLILISCIRKNFRYYSKYIILFNTIFINYGNDIAKNPQFRIYYIYKLYKMINKILRIFI